MSQISSSVSTGVVVPEQSFADFEQDLRNDSLWSRRPYVVFSTEEFRLVEQCQTERILSFKATAARVAKCALLAFTILVPIFVFVPIYYYFYRLEEKCIEKKNQCNKDSICKVMNEANRHFNTDVRDRPFPLFIKEDGQKKTEVTTDLAEKFKRTVTEMNIPSLQKYFIISLSTQQGFTAVSALFMKDGWLNYGNSGEQANQSTVVDLSKQQLTARLCSKVKRIEASPQNHDPIIETVIRYDFKKMTIQVTRKFKPVNPKLKCHPIGQS